MRTRAYYVCVRYDSSDYVEKFIYGKCERIVLLRIIAAPASAACARSRSVVVYFKIIEAMPTTDIKHYCTAVQILPVLASSLEIQNKLI